MKTCIHCPAEITRGICCDRCDATLEIMAVIARHWKPDELEKLRDMLRKEGIQEAYRTACDQKISIKAKLLWYIIEGGRRIGAGPDVMRSKVCDAINAELAAMEMAANHDKKHGEGAYMDHCAKWLGKNVGEALGGVTVTREKTTLMEEAVK